ncbi:aspartate/glutamate racemase family protein [Pseudarthrobacter sp. H3Y2-7]|uniref:aspartate/glutamate racemase family protein n=1 Tax=Pseudarthrobacter naphthalenicus TaxID=3031328 RepID=UPI0023AF6F30|nr:aspartate/glutamate racemase family protein [Pseudarthrobacter sp. H3Y2-7]MDE8670751.1 aspartate/glutamate racemase family protein [Pseudarthrobacter sp. H3Y2-7]
MTELRPDGPATVGFLHTAQVHLSSFESLARELLPSARTIHRVDPEALELARQDGPRERVRAVVAGYLSELREAGCEVILCTCSTLGEVAEGLSGDGLQVIRIDRPMLRRAVTLGPRIGVVAALTSTVEPTARVLAQEAADAGVAISLEVSVVADAWDAFLSGDAEGYRSLVAHAARALSGRCDVVVLAQASMEPAAALLTGLATPILTSPRSAVEVVATVIPSR